MQVCSEVADLARFHLLPVQLLHVAARTVYFRHRILITYFCHRSSLAKIAGLVSVWSLNVMVLRQHFCARFVHDFCQSLGMEM